MEKSKIDKLIDKAGFIRFSEEEDSEMPIDWSSDYTSEIQTLVHLVVSECINICNRVGDEIEVSRPNKDLGVAAWECAAKIRDHFKS
jgi:hypothetical protein